MKRYVYVLCLLVSLVSINSCKKESEPEPQPVIGKWTADYVLWSGLVAPYTGANGRKLSALNYYGLNQVYDVKADKTFLLTDRSSILVETAPGTWDYTGTKLDLKFDDGDQSALNYDISDGTPHLVSEVLDASDSLVNPTTKKPELVKFKAQLVYSKQ